MLFDLGTASALARRNCRTCGCWRERDGGRLALARLISYMEQRRASAIALGRRARRVQACRAGSSAARSTPSPDAHLAQRYGELVPDPDVVLLEDVGHYPQLEAPDRVVDEYEAVPRRGGCTAQPNTNTLTRMSAIPIKAAPAISPAQIGSCASTQSACAPSGRRAVAAGRIPEEAGSEEHHQRRVWRKHHAESDRERREREAARGADSQEFHAQRGDPAIADRPADRMVSAAAALSRRPRSTRSETPFHWRAAGNPNFS